MTYTLTVSNVPASDTIGGPFTVTDTLPSGLTLVSMAGDGWICTSNTCSRADSLAPASSFPPITVTVNVSSYATSPQVNTATVTAGTASASATDSTIVMSCDYTLNPGGQTFTASGGVATFSVIASGNCPWTAWSNVSWAAISSGASGAGSGTVTYQVAANTGAARSGMLTVAGIGFNVAQAGFSAAGSLAQVNSGGAWNTTITLLNAGAVPAQVVLNFFDDNGKPLALPLVFPQTSATAPVTAATLNQTIGAGAQFVVQTAGTANQAALAGWMQLLASGGNAGGSAVLAVSTQGGVQQATIPIETRNPSAFVMAFDNTGGYSNEIAVANLSSQAVSVPVVLRDSAGASLGTSTIALAAYGHTSFVLAGNYPATAGKAGEIELDTPAGGAIGTLGIRNAPDGEISSIPAMAK